MMSMLRLGILSAAALFGQSAAAAIITPGAMGGWTNRPYDGAVSGITNTYPRSGGGSIEITLPDQNAGADWIYPIASRPRLSAFSSASYEFWRDERSTNAYYQAPSYAMYVDADCDDETDDATWLIYEPPYQPPELSTVPTNQWVTHRITPASIVWQASDRAIAPFLPLSDYMAGNVRRGNIRLNGDSCILYAAALAGSGWDGFHGAIDNVTLTVVGEGQIVNANFELVAPISGGGVAAVPTMGEWALILMATVMAAATAFGQRGRSHRR